MKQFLILLAGVITAISLQVTAASLEDRIKPAGSVCMAGEPCAAAPITLAAASAPRTGKQVYDSKCATCHATGAAGAPKLGDVAAWEPRIAKSIATLHTHAIEGFNGMPAKGLCFDCSDEEIKASVDYLVENSK